MRACELIRMPNGEMVTAADAKFLYDVLGPDGAREIMSMKGVRPQTLGAYYIGRDAFGRPTRMRGRDPQAVAREKTMWASLGAEGEKMRAAGKDYWQAKHYLERSGRAPYQRRMAAAAPSSPPAAKAPRSVTAPPLQRQAAGRGGGVRGAWARKLKGASMGAVEVDPTKARPWYADLAEQALTVWQSEQLRKENARRIREGLPPLTQAQARALAPTANVNLSLPNEVKIGAMLAGAALLIAVLGSKRRR